MASLSAMYLIKRMQQAQKNMKDSGVVNVLVHDSSRGELDDVRMIPVKVEASK